MTDASMVSISQIKGMIEKDPEPQGRLISPKQGAIKYNMSRTSFTKLALQAGSVYKIERVLLIDVEKFEAYLENFRLVGLDG